MVSRLGVGLAVKRGFVIHRGHWSAIQYGWESAWMLRVARLGWYL